MNLKAKICINLHIDEIYHIRYFFKKSIFENIVYSYYKKLKKKNQKNHSFNVKF